MYQHDYDENGLPTSYLLLTILAPLAIYLSYTAYKGSKRFPCRCKACLSQVHHRSYSKLILPTILWIIVCCLIYKIWTGTYAPKRSTFDPLEILGIEEGTTLPVIKKAYRKKVRDAQRNPKVGEDSSGALSMINKAFEIVKNPEEYSRWLRNTTEEKQIIAIPAFVLRAGLLPCILYFLILVSTVPFFIYFSIRSVRDKSRFGVLYESVESFWENIDTFSKNEQIIIPQVLLFISKCKEFANYPWRHELVDLKKTIENCYGFPVLSTEPGYLHIVDYLCRTGRAEYSDMCYTKEMLYNFIRSFIEVSKTCTKLRLFRALIMLEKMVAQAVHSPELYLLQFPNISLANALEFSCKPVSPLDSLMERERSAIMKYLDGQERSEALSILEKIPKLVIDDIKVYVIDTELREDDCLEGDFKHLSCMKGNEVRIERGATPTVALKLRNAGGIPMCHSPYGAGRIPLKWTFFYMLDGEIQPGMRELEYFDGTKEIDFAFKFSTGNSSELRIIAILNGYFRADLEKSILIKYY